MDNSVFVPIISGIFTLLAVWLTHHLNKKTGSIVEPNSFQQVDDPVEFGVPNIYELPPSRKWSARFKKLIIDATIWGGIFTLLFILWEFSGDDPWYYFKHKYYPYHIYELTGFIAVFFSLCLMVGSCFIVLRYMYELLWTRFEFKIRASDCVSSFLKFVVFFGCGSGIIIILDPHVRLRFILASGWCLFSFGTFYFIGFVFELFFALLNAIRSFRKGLYARL